ncbi:MAG: class I SAM-dependent methyltransferase [Candidatus Latescibacteria bacterium]|nr:class I SAM-dependent methyltransferase [Candidatus Latescibacterota bacterium]
MASTEAEKMWAELAPYYDVLYQWKDYRSEAARIHQLIQSHRLSSGNALLDVACGTGEHTRYLREHYRVTGIDLNPEMLKIARRKVPGVSFLRRDMTFFDLKRRFDAIVCLFSSIAYVRTYRKLRQTVACFGRHLKPGGILVIEPFFTTGTFRPGSINGGTMEREGVRISRHSVSRRRGNLAVLDFHFLLSTKLGVRYFRDIHELALFDSERFLDILEDEGLRPEFDSHGLMQDRGLYLALKQRA